MFKRKALAAAATGAVSFGLIFTTSGVASAADATFPNSGYGFDGNAHLIVGGGSVTLFKMVQSLATLWEDTQTCATNLSSYNAAGTQPVPYPQASPAFNQCAPSSGQSFAGFAAGGNFDADTVAAAEPAGSSTGIGSLNGSHAGNTATYAYEGTNTNLTTSGDPNALQLGTGVQVSNGYGTADFDYSSRAAKTSGGNCAPAGDELTCDTFWGVASDGVGVYTFDSSSGAFSGAGGVTDGLSAQDLFAVFNCDITTWGDLPEWQAANTAGVTGLPASNAPIVPWSMNSTSGTFGDFNTWIANNATGVPSGWTVNNTCDRELTTSGGTAFASQPFPVENDFKPEIIETGTNAFNSNLYTWPPAQVGPPFQEGSPYPANASFPAGVTTTNPLSPQNPNNWIWFGSFSLLTQFPFLSSSTGLPTPTGNVAYSSGVNAISNTTGSSGVVPSQTNIQGGTYPIERILSIVTKKSDADCPVTASVCNFTANPGPNSGNGQTDFNVLGATGGKGGAVREFVRFLCRPGTGTFALGTNLAPADIYTGASMSASSATGTNGEINTVGVENSSGFRPVPVSVRSPGSTCDVKSVG